MALQCHPVALKKQKKHRSRSKSGVALCHGVPPSRSLLAPFPHSLLLNRTETLATRAMADRESSVALCHGVALKKKRDRGPRERRRSVPRGGVKTKKWREIGRGPREQYRSVPRDGVKKERIGRGPREQYRSVPWDGVKKERIGRGPRELCRSVSQGGIKKKRRERERDRSRTERAVSLSATGWR